MRTLVVVLVVSVAGLLAGAQGPLVSAEQTPLPLAGQGIPRCDIPKSFGRLVTFLNDRTFSGGGIFAVYPHRRYLPAKVRVFVDFLVQWFKAPRV